MKLRSCGLTVVLMMLGGASAVFAQTSTRSVQGLAFMAGCWESAAGKNAQITEQWMKPAGGMMIGMGRTIAGGKAVDHEFMRIEQRGDDVVFIARPKANKEDTVFKLITLTAAEAVFENPTHDFPQRVIYRLGPTGGLNGRIEGTINGKA